MISDNEKTLVALFADNTEQFDAVRKTLIATMEQELDGLVVRLRKDRSLTNKQIGEQLRACAEGIQKVEKGFTDLAQYKKQEDALLKTHPGR